MDLVERQAVQEEQAKKVLSLFIYLLLILFILDVLEEGTANQEDSLGGGGGSHQVCFNINMIRENDSPTSPLKYWMNLSLCRSVLGAASSCSGLTGSCSVLACRSLRKISRGTKVVVSSLS